MSHAVPRFRILADAPRRWLRRIVRLSHIHRWKEQELISKDGALYYRVRDCRCGRREIAGAITGRWSDVSKVKFSLLECFEDWHREQYMNATPREPNVPDEPRGK